MAMDPDPPPQIENGPPKAKAKFNELSRDVDWCIDEIKRLRRALGNNTGSSAGDDPIRAVQQQDNGTYVLGTYRNGTFTAD